MNKIRDQIIGINFFVITSETTPNIDFTNFILT
jgi:hypothetical protein